MSSRLGRFVPGDPRVEEPYRLTPQTALRVAIVGFAALGIFAVLILRLWALQVLSGDKYLAQATQNRVRTIQIDAPRGVVLDRYGHVLVSNVAGTSLEVWPADLPKTWPAQKAELKALAAITHLSLKEILAKIKPYAQDPLTPVILVRGVHDDQIAYLKEHQLQFPGVQLADSFLRRYRYESLGAHFLGYVGEINQTQLDAQSGQGYALGDIIGQAGVESEYDIYLRGHDGTAQLTVDSRGRPTSAITPKVNPRPGNALRLTIDIGLQRAAERALKYGITLARQNSEPYADGGAIVAIDPRDGSILALASYPTYQPSVYVSRDPKKLAPLQNQVVAAKDNFPGLDRALSVTYPPGSTWKPVTALAAMQEHILSPYSSLLCSPDFKVKGQTGVGQLFHNWDPNVNHWMELPEALAESCDTYFYQLGYDFYKLPATRGHPLQAWAARFGFGAPTGVDLGPEASGLVPTPEWRRKTFTGKPFTAVDRVWKPGYSVQLAIGQGDVEVTPLQMTRFYALLANGGRLVTPHIVEDVEQETSTPSNPTVLRSFTPPVPTDTGIDPAALAAVQQGLYAGTHGTTGTSSGVFGSFPVSIAGKTGTAEKLISLPGYPHPLKLNQSWWCGYGPTESPSIAVCAVIENGGHGGTAAAPAALRVFEKYFHKHGVLTTHKTD
ncbi:MAG: penicillin-binding protein 2 [Actinobacteria bacterium]|nr:penicillin-binding protein 2 [Actinomycetota bacterium]